MILEKSIGTYATLLLAGKQDEGYGSLRRESERFQSTGGLQHRHCTGTVVECALPQVPGVEVAANHDPFLRELRTFDFSHGD